MAVAAGTRDPRFSPLSRQELSSVDIEISVLTPPRAVESVDEIQIGRDGLVISRGYSRGVLLPQVAVEQDWDRTTFLQQTCRKAGLPPNAWEQSGTVIEVFTAEVFGEHSE
jgi:AmmeMemoRadiSam system protein A